MKKSDGPRQPVDAAGALWTTQKLAQGHYLHGGGFLAMS